MRPPRPPPRTPRPGRVARSSSSKSTSARWTWSTTSRASRSRARGSPPPKAVVRDVEAQAEEVRVHALEQRVDLARRLHVAARRRLERDAEAALAAVLGRAVGVVDEQPLAALSGPRLAVPLDRAREADAIGLADGVREQHERQGAAIGGVAQQAERAVEAAHVLGEALLARETQRQASLRPARGRSRRAASRPRGPRRRCRVAPSSQPA